MICQNWSHWAELIPDSADLACKNLSECFGFGAQILFLNFYLSFIFSGLLLCLIRNRFSAEQYTFENACVWHSLAGGIVEALPVYSTSWCSVGSLWKAASEEAVNSWAQFMAAGLESCIFG